MTRRRARWVAVVMTAAVVVLTGCSSGLDRYGGFSFVSPGGAVELSYPAGERGSIGALSGPDLTGDGTISLSDFPGKIVVLNVWGSWCGPCRGEVDSLNLAAALTSEKGAQFLGINVKDTREAGADFHRARQVPYPSIFDPSMRTLLSISGFPTSSIPATIILDREHRVARIFLRVVQTGELVTAVTELAAETSPDSSVGGTPTPATSGTGGP